MRGYHVIASMLRVDRSDDCVWLVDERGQQAQNIHMTPDQATAAGEALLEAGGSSSSSMSLPVTARADVIDLSQYDRCTGCSKMTQKSKLSSGRCDTCSSPATGMPMAASLDSDEIVGVVVAALMDKWRLDEDQKRDLERLSQARDKIQPSAEVYAAIPDRFANKLQGAVLMIEKFIERAEKAVRANDQRAAETSRGLARKKLMGLVEILAGQQLSGYTSGLTEAHRLLAVA